MNSSSISGDCSSRVILNTSLLPTFSMTTIRPSVSRFSLPSKGWTPCWTSSTALPQLGDVVTSWKSLL